MAVSVNDVTQRLAGLGRNRIAKRARQPRVLLRVDDDEAVRRLDRAGIGIAAGANPRMHAVGDCDELRLRLEFSHAARFRLSLARMRPAKSSHCNAPLDSPSGGRSLTPLLSRQNRRVRSTERAYES